MRFFLLSVVLTAASYCHLATAQTIKVVSDVWPPLVMDDPDHPGIDVEVMTAVFNDIGVNVELTIYPWKRAISSTKSGEMDAILDIFDTPERREWLWFHQTPISVNQSALFCKGCDASDVITEEEMGSKSLIVNLGYKYTKYVDNPSVTKFEVSSFEQGFHMLDLDRADYYLVNRTVGLYTVSQMGMSDIRPLDMGIEDPSPSFLGFAKKDALKPLVDKFDQALVRFKGSTEYRNILIKYGVASHSAAE